MNFHTHRPQICRDGGDTVHALDLSSFASRMIVVPCASAPATASTGSSSITFGTSLPSMMVPVRGATLDVNNTRELSFVALDDFSHTSTHSDEDVEDPVQ